MALNTVGETAYNEFKMSAKEKTLVDCKKGIEHGLFGQVERSGRRSKVGITPINANISESTEHL